VVVADIACKRDLAPGFGLRLVFQAQLHKPDAKRH
jgi:hypothetical protein